MADGFTFPALPKPRALQRGAPGTNPLLAGATVTDRSSAAQAAGVQPSAPPGAAAAAAAPAADGDAAMGGVLGTPVLSRHHRISPAPRRKVPFEKGFSQMDWLRLTQTQPDLAGLGGARPRRDITLEEVARHAARDDAWTVLRGKVYNITHYLRFHPGGGPILMKVAGKDGTALFNKYHAWVNDDFLLAKCLVGLLAPPSAGGAAAAAGAGAAGEVAERGAAEEAAAGAPAAAPAAGGGSSSSSTTDLQSAAEDAP